MIQGTLAALLGVSPSYISKLENGREVPSAKLLQEYQRLARSGRQAAPPAPKKDQSGRRRLRGSVTILYDDVTLRLEPGEPHELIAIHNVRLRALRDDVKNLFFLRCPIEEEDKWEFELTYGGEPGQGQSVSGYRDLGIVLHAPLQSGEEHEVGFGVFIPYADSYLVYRSVEYDVREMTLRVWAIPSVAHRYRFWRIDNHDSAEPIRASRGYPLDANTNGFLRTEFLYLKPGRGYGVAWTVA